MPTVTFSSDVLIKQTEQLCHQQQLLLRPQQKLHRHTVTCHLLLFSLLFVLLYFFYFV